MPVPTTRARVTRSAPSSASRTRAVRRLHARPGAQPRVDQAHRGARAAADGLRPRPAAARDGRAPGGGRIARPSGLTAHMGPQPRTVDQRIARLGSRAKGIVTHAELIAAGITAKEIRGRRARGSLLAVFRGVYRVGHAATSIEATEMAAV